MKPLQVAISNSPTAQPQRSRFIADALPRGLALFFGCFSLLNVLGNLKVHGFDANLWWIDLRWLPAWMANGFLILAAICLISFAWRPPRSQWRRSFTLISAGTLSIVSLLNAFTFLFLLLRGTVVSSLPLPLSLMVTMAMLLIVRALVKPATLDNHTGRPWAVLAVCAACAFLFPLAEMLCFGKTDYRRPADVAVVLGCRVYADGRPSDALKDRVRTACQLYRDGLARKLLFSGGPGDGVIPETEAMRRMALQLGVKAEDILLDDQGLNTQATVRNSKPVFSALNASRILVVSHFYHLPRIKLAYQRAGLEVYTVPARESYLLRQMPYNMAREVAALWVYYVRPLATRSA